MKSKDFTTLEACMDAVRNDGWDLWYVPEELKTAEICLIAVQNKGSALEYVPEGLKTAELCLAAVQNGGSSLIFVPEELRTAELCLTAVRNCAWVFRLVPEELKTADMCWDAVQRAGGVLKYVPEYLKTLDLCLAAVQSSGWALEYVPEELKTTEICLAAVQSNGWALKYVPEDLKTAEVCLAAVQEDVDVFKYVPEELKAVVLGELLVEQSGKNEDSDNILPPLSLLTPPPSDRTADYDRSELEDKGRELIACLERFSVRGKLLRIVPGPVVSMFEFRPDPVVKVSRIASLGENIALAMKVLPVRVQVLIPGTDNIGIEIPNVNREKVFLSEILASPAFTKSKAPLTIALGKDISGEPTVADLAKMPHLLFAGMEGSGKTVCVNSILLSLIFRNTPDQLKLLLVDPKRIELEVYKDLPHLVHPVVTELSDFRNALDWAVHEMDQRYAAIAQLGVSDISGYNAKLAVLKNKQPEKAAEFSFMPYLVIIIDELADLMLTAGRETEWDIVRLAKMGRDAGIHLILSTQRPSVDVVTGLIKANFPCRIAFQVSSKHESRTILDSSGAEDLLYYGDMLFKPGGEHLLRLQGAFAPEEDVAAVVDFWKQRMPPSYELDFSQWEKE